MAKLALTPHFPTYQQACEFVRVVDGLPLVALHSMMSAIRQQMGTPQEQVDWTEPDTWISTRLAGQDADLARRIWTESHGIVNPRHVRGSLTFARRHELILVDAGGVCHKTPIGDAYIAGDLVTHQRIDGLEGVHRVLLLLSSRTSATSPELLSEWLDYLRGESSIYSETFARQSLWARLRYLVTCRLATRNGSYVITAEGREYMDTLKDGTDSADSDVARAAVSHNTRTQAKLKEALAEMNPFVFEELVGELLTAMGYQDVEVTAATGDKGVVSVWDFDPGYFAAGDNELSDC